MDKRDSEPLPNTTALYHQLLTSESLEQYLQKNADALQLPEFHVYVARLCQRRGELPEHVIRRTNLERSYGHQLFKGTRKPSRDTVLQLAFGLEADVETTQELLKLAQKNLLYPRVPRDSAILYCLHNRFSLVDVQLVLQKLGLPVLGGKQA